MRKVILSLAVSLDGFIEGPNREIDWLEFTEETGKVLNQFLQEIDTVLYGRVSYDTWGTYTPPDNSSDFEKNFYNALGQMTKYVFSASRSEFAGKPIVVKSNIEETIRKLKQQPGKDIWLYGGAGLITTFVNLDLVDEFRIAVAPIILGSGRPLFKDIDHRVKLKLKEIQSDKTGIVGLNYERISM